MQTRQFTLYPFSKNFHFPKSPKQINISPNNAKIPYPFTIFRKFLNQHPNNEII